MAMSAAYAIGSPSALPAKPLPAPLAKLWELETQHCVQTLVGHRSEIWSLAVTGDGARVVTVKSQHHTHASTFRHSR